MIHSKHKGKSSKGAAARTKDDKDGSNSSAGTNRKVEGKTIGEPSLNDNKEELDESKKPSAESFPTATTLAETATSPKTKSSLDIWVPQAKRRRPMNAAAKKDDDIDDNDDCLVATGSLGSEKKYPVPPNIVQIITKPRTYVNHTYRDFSNVPSVQPQEMFHVSALSNTSTTQQQLEQLSFHMKVYHILASNCDSSTASATPQSNPMTTSTGMEWCTHGRAFRIGNVNALEFQLQSYFGHSRLSKFRKQLFNHDFKLITAGADANCFYSEFLLRGLPHVTQYAPAPIERRKLLPDPDNEPNFYRISKLFPLPGTDETMQLEIEARKALAQRGIIIPQNPLPNTTSATGSSPAVTDTTTLLGVNTISTITGAIDGAISRYNLHNIQLPSITTSSTSPFTSRTSSAANVASAANRMPTMATSLMNDNQRLQELRLQSIYQSLHGTDRATDSLLQQQQPTSSFTSNLLDPRISSNSVPSSSNLNSSLLNSLLLRNANQLQLQQQLDYHQQLLLQRNAPDQLLASLGYNTNNSNRNQLQQLLSPDIRLSDRVNNVYLQHLQQQLHQQQQQLNEQLQAHQPLPPSVASNTINTTNPSDQQYQAGPSNNDSNNTNNLNVFRQNNRSM